VSSSSLPLVGVKNRENHDRHDPILSRRGGDLISAQEREGDRARKNSMDGWRSSSALIPISERATTLNVGLGEIGRCNEARRCPLEGRRMHLGTHCAIERTLRNARPAVQKEVVSGFKGAPRWAGGFFLPLLQTT
jgi:hypothetical protein